MGLEEGKEHKKTLSLDLSVELMQGIDAYEARTRHRGEQLRRFLMNEVDRCYDVTRKEQVSAINFERGLPAGKTMRVGLSIPESYVMALDSLCEGIPITRKSLAEYFISHSYMVWKNGEGK